MQILFEQHINRLQHIIQNALFQCQADGLWIYAGKVKYHFLDDQSAPFKINPHFNYFFPSTTAENSWLFLDGVNKPKIYFYSPQDYWHCVTQAPQNSYFSSAFDWHILTNEEQIKHQITTPEKMIFIGEDEHLARSLNFRQINPQKTLNLLHFERSIKTEYEITCIYQAQLTALQGHLAAKQAFEMGLSEFEVNLAYLKATHQSDNDVPYGNIIAYNQHAAILHYTQRDLQPPKTTYSFLIDAGTNFAGYASDLTRTYSFNPNDEFATLVDKMNEKKLQLIDQLQVGYNYLTYHTQMHQWISELLNEFNFINLPADQIFETGISRSFFPHGLGHLLGLQVHDVAGLQQNARGTHKLPPEIYPSLRCTRNLEKGMVLTIEPGIYFIEMLLSPWQNSNLARHFNWSKIEEFKKYGGIRTEDNIVMEAENARNLTAEAEKELLFN